MVDTFTDVSLVIVLAAALGILAHILRQPTIVAYLITGVIISSFGVLQLNSQNVLQVMATFGITFLLFLVGLEMRFDQLKTVGRTILITGIGQICITTLIGYWITTLFGFSHIQSFYIGIALAFSSTIVVIKLLSEKRDLQSLYGRITVGFLLLQDVVAIIILMILSGFQESHTIQNSAFNILLILIKAILLFSLTIWLSRKIIPKLVERFVHNNELLFIGSVAWAFAIAVIVSSKFIGFSIEIGGFLAGLALANSAEQFQITARIRPLRDFFIVIFFIVLGSTLVLANISDILLPALILSLFVIFVEPLVVLIIMGMLGYRKRTSFMAGITIGQVSEFSLIIIALGNKIGHINNRVASLVTLVGVTTMMVSAYLILNSEALYSMLRPILSIFQRKVHIEKSTATKHVSEHIILIGAHRLGQYLLKNLPKNSVVIVEFDPIIARKLQRKGYEVIMGDISDPEVIEVLNAEHAELIISTVPHFEENMSLIKFVHQLPIARKPSIIVNAQHEWEAKKYYTNGANYVLFPHFVGAEHLAQLFENGKWNHSQTEKLRKHDIAILGT